ncbi:MAG TPA: sugar phosphate isomerase/epimerase family protein [Trueperaceae bacterium]|nr:sugar phosphate isomerase/epimerase family protein [Trueperaceae bacterium]HRP45951.1 sugar phosphate isomerase/epimerase family protein [Trueperaceae bacterium]
MPEPRSRPPFTLALCNEVVRELSFAAQCALAASLGYDALEVAPFTLAADPRDLTDRDLERLRMQAQDAGIGVSSLHWLLTAPSGLSITTADLGVRRTTLEVMHALVDACAALGGSVLVHGSPQQRRLSDEDPVGDAQRASEAFALIATAAERAGVTYCIEPLSTQETAFINTVAEAEAIVRQVGSPALKTMLDTRAARLAEAASAEAVLARGLKAGTIAHVHVNDTSKGGPGQGTDGFAGIFEVLLAAGYAGTVAVEPFEYLPDGPTSAARAAGYVQGVIEGLTR